MNKERQEKPQVETTTTNSLTQITELINNAFITGEPIDTGYIDEDIPEKPSEIGCDREGCMDGYIEVNGKFEYCECYKEHLFKVQLNKARIPKEYHELRNIDEKDLQVAKLPYGKPFSEHLPVQINKETRVINTNFDSLKEGGWNFIMEGPTGTGKTTFATIIGKIAIKREYSTLFIELEELRRLWTGEELEEDLKMAKKLIYTVDVLILDDLGKEFKSERSEYFLTNFDSLIRQRIANKKMNIFTTNLTIDKLQERYDERIVSLFKRNMVHYILNRRHDLRDDNGLPEFLR